MEYTKQLKKALLIAKRISKKLKHNYIGTEHLLIGLIDAEDSLSSQVLQSEGLNSNIIINLINDLVSMPSIEASASEEGGYTPKLEHVLIEAKEEAILCKATRIGTEHALLALLRMPDCAGSRLLSSVGNGLQKLFSECIIAMGSEGEIYREEMIARGKALGDSETPNLDKYCNDITMKAARGELDPIIGRDDEIQRTIQILSRRTKNNPCLIGEPGVGKTAIIESLATRIIIGAVPDSVKDKRVLSLDLSGMVAGTKYRGEFEERIKGVIEEITKSKDVLLFIDELHTLIGAGGASGSLDAANILKPALARGSVQVIGATTISEYRKHIEKDSALERRFQPIIVEEPTPNECKNILKGIKDKYEQHHNVLISDAAIDACVELSTRYISDRFLPDKAIDLMDEASARKRIYRVNHKDNLIEIDEQIQILEEEMVDALKESNLALAREKKANRDNLINRLEQSLKRKNRKSNSKQLLVDETDVASVVALWTKIPVDKLSESESIRLVNLEKRLHKRIIGQDEAVSAVSRAVRRGRVGLKEPNRPIGSFLFLGPTGVGKTEVSKALAEEIFGSEDNMIRVDMTEYMEKHSVAKMVGSPPGYVGFEEGGQLSEKVRRNPYSVILFDEIEKAHPDVFNILLQVLDDGRITDSQGRKVDFKNTIIIMTSNIGARDIVEPKKLGFLSTEENEADFERMKSKVMEALKQEFKPEFLNRIDEQIVFKSLGKDEMRRIVTLMTKSLIDRCNTQMNIKLSILPSVKNLIVEDSYDPKFGARPLRRKIQTDLEDKLAEDLLAHRINSGDEVKATVKNKKIVFEVIKPKKTRRNKNAKK